MEPLVIVFVWNTADEYKMQRYVDYVTSKLTSDVENPFSRSLNIPIYYFFNQKEDTTPPDFDFKAERVIVFPFIGENSVIFDNWKLYLNNMAKNNTIKVVPIALDETAFNIGELSNKNFIRFYDFHDLKDQRLFLSIAHEIYRSGFNYTDKDMSATDAALKIFLSHAKDASIGVDLALELKKQIEESTMKYFFDTTDIAPGYNFSQEIACNIKNSTMLLINSDIYSSRYWCQREVQMSKEFECPIIEVDLIVQGSDRKFPYAGNVPVVRVDIVGNKPEKDDVLRVLEYALIETIRFYYSKKKLDMFDDSVKKMYRPPEMIDLSKIIQKNTITNNIELLYTEIVYPDPPLHSEEIDFFNNIGIQTYTPVCNLQNSLINKKIGISISNPSILELNQLGMNNSHIEKLSKMIAKYILVGGGKLIYGGDLRENSFTRLLVDEAAILMDRFKTSKLYLENYVAFPAYNANKEEMKSFEAKYCQFLKLIKVDIADSIEFTVHDKNLFFAPDTLADRIVWSKSLTKMRETMIAKCDIRICAGGAKSGYKGAMPGILEEILIAQKHTQPIYLVGGFGGITKDICELIQGRANPVELTVEWQLNSNFGYSEVLSYYSQTGEDICYNAIADSLRNLDLHNGLSHQENIVLFNSSYVDEVISLIMKGIKTIS